MILKVHSHIIKMKVNLQTTNAHLLIRNLLKTNIKIIRINREV
jgi:hypothetical protein